jgi:hypothetical protein
MRTKRPFRLGSVSAPGQIEFMKSDTRRAVAYIAGRVISGKAASSVYDYAEGRHQSFSGTVSSDAANVYDYASACHIGGRLGSLFHYGHSAQVQLRLTGTRFDGFDYDESRHFSGDVRGSSITLFDYATSTHYRYSL